MHLMYERGHNELGRFFGYHRDFKYPLAGEFCFTAELARSINIAYDWGLEVSTLSEVYHRVIQPKIAQIDLTSNYEHKHQALSPDEAGKGLHRMVVDIAKFYLNYMRSHGVPLDDAFVDMVLHTYYQSALVFIKSYSDDAEVNGLVFDRHEEELYAQYFRGFLWTALGTDQRSPGKHANSFLEPRCLQLSRYLPNAYGGGGGRQPVNGEKPQNMYSKQYRRRRHFILKAAFRRFELFLSYPMFG